MNQSPAATKIDSLSQYWVGSSLWKVFIRINQSSGLLCLKLNTASIGSQKQALPNYWACTCTRSHLPSNWIFGSRSMQLVATGKRGPRIFSLPIFLFPAHIRTMDLTLPSIHLLCIKPSNKHCITSFLNKKKRKTAVVKLIYKPSSKEVKSGSSLKNAGFITGENSSKRCLAHYYLTSGFRKSSDRHH